MARWNIILAAAERPSVLVLLGPTAAGKSEAAVAVAKTLGAEVISADSVQVYRGLDVGTAKPTVAERQGVPHHLIDVIEPGEAMSVAHFTDLATAAIADVVKRGRPPLVSGGTGLYLRAALGEWQVVRAPPDQALRAAWQERIKTEGPGALWQEVARRYPDRARSISSQDVIRLLRVLEVEGRQGSAQPSPYRLLKVGWWRSRAEIAARLEVRAAKLWNGGMVEEARGLVALGLPRDRPPLASLGYREAAAMLAGEVSRKTAMETFLTRSRRLAKRQMTWWRTEHDICWLHAEADGLDRLIQVAGAFFAGEDVRLVCKELPYQTPHY